MLPDHRSVRTPLVPRKMLDGGDFQIVEARNLREARDALSSFRPCVIILDIILRGEDTWELLAELNGGLLATSGCLSGEINRAFQAMRDLYTGIFYVNAPTIGAEVHLPFGGTKATGNGHREAGTAALDVFSEWKSVYVDFSGKLQRAQIDTADV